MVAFSRVAAQRSLAISKWSRPLGLLFVKALSVDKAIAIARKVSKRWIIRLSELMVAGSS